MDIQSKDKKVVLHSHHDKRPIVSKPWGREVMLGDMEHYMFKRLEIKKGYETSLQFHKEKAETLHLIEGEAELVYQDADGEYKTTKLSPGATINVHPQGVHRMRALTNIVIVEASTPDHSHQDVVRLEDGKFNRGDGRIDSEHK